MHVAVNKNDENKGLGWTGQERGEGAWRSQLMHCSHGAPLRREGPRERIVIKIPAPRRGTRACRWL